jgi:predicted anti-sigma-YlaC factor YlaD
MDCDRAREAISAQIDGEDTGLSGPDWPSDALDALDAHLAGCAACAQWQARAHAVTRRARLGGSFLDHDLTAAVLAAAASTAAVPTRPQRQRIALRGGLTALALGQFAIALPMLFLGHDHGAGLHAAHELGSFNLALAVAFAVGAVRPALSAGLAWPCAIAAGGLVTTAVIDLIGGQAIGADEAQHLVALAGAALLAWQSRLGDADRAGPVVRPSADPAVTRLGSAVTEAPAPFDGQPAHPWGGDAARIATPDVAAQTRPGQTRPAQAPDEEVA